MSPPTPRFRLCHNRSSVIKVVGKEQKVQIIEIFSLFGSSFEPKVGDYFNKILKN